MARRLSILVVEDDPLVRELLRVRIEQAGYEAHQAANGAEAQSLLRHRAFDVVITDILMPVVDGLQLIAHLRKTSPATRVIAMTAGGLIDREHYLSMARITGAHAGLAKPFSQESLVAALKDLFPAEPSRPL